MTWNLAVMNGLAAAAVAFGLRGGRFYTPMRKFGLKHRIQMLAFAIIFGAAFSVNSLVIELDRAASFGLMFLFLLGGFAAFWLGMIVGTLERTQGADATAERILPSRRSAAERGATLGEPIADGQREVVASSPQSRWAGDLCYKLIDNSLYRLV